MTAGIRTTANSRACCFEEPSGERRRRETPCRHSFCASAASRRCTSVPSATTSHFSCPTCRAHHLHDASPPQRDGAPPGRPAARRHAALPARRMTPASSHNPGPSTRWILVNGLPTIAACSAARGVTSCSSRTRASAPLFISPSPLTPPPSPEDAAAAANDGRGRTPLQRRRTTRRALERAPAALGARARARVPAENESDGDETLFGAVALAPAATGFGGRRP